MARKYQRKLQQDIRNKQNSSIATTAASQSERVSANDSKPVGKTEPINAELHRHHPHAEQTDKPTTKMPKLSFKRKKNAAGKCGKRKKANIDPIREKAIDPDSEASATSSARESAAEPAAAAAAAAATSTTTTNAATARTAASANSAPDSGSSIWSKFKQLGSARQNPSSSNLETNNEGSASKSPKIESSKMTTHGWQTKSTNKKEKGDAAQGRLRERNISATDKMQRLDQDLSNDVTHYSRVANSISNIEK